MKKFYFNWIRGEMWLCECTATLISKTEDMRTGKVQCKYSLKHYNGHTSTVSSMDGLYDHPEEAVKAFSESIIATNRINIKDIYHAHV